MEIPRAGAVAGRSPSSVSTVLRRFLRTPKGTLLPVLLGLAAIAGSMRTPTRYPRWRRASPGRSGSTSWR